MTIRMANDLTLPEDASTQTHAFLARKGGGKTYAAGVLVEGLLERGVPVVVIEPIGNWYGLQMSRDGRSPGFAIPVFGGAHGNVPLVAEQGEALAQLLATRNLSAVVDVSGFRKNERKRFVAEFAEAYFHAVKAAPAPRTIVLEESQVFAPQRADRGSERMLGAVEDIVRLGRNYGLGAVLISQRPQSVNKEVLNQVESLFVGQLGAPQERKAIADWVTERGADRRLLDELPSLQPGEMIFWSPQWMRTLKRVRIARKRTLDASATPTLGTQPPRARRAAAIDAAELHKALALSTAQETHRVSPSSARKAPRASHDVAAAQRIADLEAECARLRAEQQKLPQLRRLGKQLGEQLESLARLSAELAGAVGDAAPSAIAPITVERPPPRPARAARSASPRPLAAHSSKGAASSPAGLRSGALRMLTVLATFYPGAMSRAQTARAAGLRVSSGTFATYWSNLRQQGLLEEAGVGLYRATGLGLEALGSARPQVPKSFAERKAFWEARLRAGERRILDVVIESADGITREELAAAVQMSATSGTFATYLSTLTNNRLTAREGNRVVVHPWLLKGPTAA